MSKERKQLKERKLKNTNKKWYSEYKEGKVLLQPTVRFSCVSSTWAVHFGLIINWFSVPGLIPPLVTPGYLLSSSIFICYLVMGPSTAKRRKKDDRWDSQGPPCSWPVLRLVYDRAYYIVVYIDLALDTHSAQRTYLPVLRSFINWILPHAVPPVATVGPPGAKCLPFENDCSAHAWSLWPCRAQSRKCVFAIPAANFRVHDSISPRRHYIHLAINFAERCFAVHSF